LAVLGCGETTDVMIYKHWEWAFWEGNGQGGEFPGISHSSSNNHLGLYIDDWGRHFGCEIPEVE
jgi:hypothetical protein